jgi:molecular chaperone GrpE
VSKDKRKADQPRPAGEAAAGKAAAPVPMGQPGTDVAEAPASGEAASASPNSGGAAKEVPGAAAAPEGGAVSATKPLGAELEALRSELDERLRDLQRVTAEYANYRKRVERDRALMAEQATGLVIATLLPILDDLDRARDHGDLVGPFGAVADQLTAALGKFGLNAFGEVGDRFDPTRHEAVAHETKSDVTEPTCTTVMRRGYLLGDRLLRPALVAVADPE